MWSLPPVALMLSPYMEMISRHEIPAAASRGTAPRQDWYTSDADGTSREPEKQTSKDRHTQLLPTDVDAYWPAIMAPCMLSPWSVLIHGDFALTLASLPHPGITAVRTPARQLFFCSEPTSFITAATPLAKQFRDRQDESAGSGGVVGATGDEWLRRREQLRVLQKREALECIAAPAVGEALLACANRDPLPPLLLPPPLLLAWSGAVVRHTMHLVALSEQPPSNALPPLPQASARDAGRLRRLLAVVIARLVRLAARVSLFTQHSRALLGRPGVCSFFDLAQSFTSKPRKLDRIVGRWRLAWRRHVMRDAGCPDGRFVQRHASWVEARVRARVADAASLQGGGSPWQPSQAPRDLLDTLLAAADMSSRGDAAGGGEGSQGIASTGGKEQERLEGSDHGDQGDGDGAAACPFAASASTSPSRSKAGGSASSLLSLQEVMDVTKDVLTAGVETTATTLSTACLMLQRYPEVAERVAAEALALPGMSGAIRSYRAAQSGEEAAMGEGEVGDAGGAGEGGRGGLHDAMVEALQPTALPYTTAVLMETARLYPAAPLLLRVALSDTTLDGVAIPKGSGLVASTAQLNRSPVWQDPEDFVPERFLAGHPDQRSAEASKAYLSFGAGPRSCVGQQLALAVSSMALAFAAADAAEAAVSAEASFDGS